MTALGQMAPSFAGHYAADLLLCDIEARGDLALGKRAIKAANFLNLSFGQFGSAVQGAFARNAEAGAVSVIAALARRTPFEVVRSVVRLVAVNVIDLVALRWGLTQEGFSHEPMHQRRMIFPVFEKGGFDVTGAIISGRKNNRFALNRANIARVRHLIVSLKSKNRTPRVHTSNPLILDTLPCNMGGVTQQQAIEGDLQ